MDYRLYEQINGLSGNSLADHVIKALANDLPAVLVVLVALTFLVPWGRRHAERRSGAVLGTAAAAVALLVSRPIAHAVDRLRPYTAHPAHSHLLIARSHDPSFPSDHAAGAFALAFGIWLYDRTLGAVLLAFATVLAFSRVYVGTHYPGDVLGGALIGVAVAAAFFAMSSTRRLIEIAATRIGSAWDGAVERLPVSGGGGRSRTR